MMRIAFKHVTYIKSNRGHDYHLQLVSETSKAGLIYLSFPRPLGDFYVMTWMSLCLGLT